MNKQSMLPDNLEPILAAALSIGNELEPDARPYYAAWLAPLGALHPLFVPSLADSLGIESVPAVAFLLNGPAAFGSHSGGAIDAKFDAAGVSHLARAALEAIGRLSDLLPALLPSPVPNQTGALH